jgi:hypothetical protein
VLNTAVGGTGEPSHRVVEDIPGPFGTLVVVVGSPVVVVDSLAVVVGIRVVVAGIRVGQTVVEEEPFGRQVVAQAAGR